VKIQRREFLHGLVGGSVALGLGYSGLRFFELLPVESATPIVEKLLRTGHNTNCDGACGHLLHIVGDKVTFIEGAGWESNIDGSMLQEFKPRVCLRGLSQIQNTYSPDRIKYPYKRTGPRGSGQFQRITWEEATTAIAENFQKVQAKYGKESVWVAPYTGALSLLEGVIGASFRFASVIGASAGDFQGDNEGDAAGPAAFNYMLYDPTAPANAGGLLDGHEYTDLPLGEQHRRDIHSRLANCLRRSEQRHEDRLPRSSLHAHRRWFGSLGANTSRHRHRTHRRDDELDYPEPPIQ